jgi:hypothetical protein
MHVSSHPISPPPSQPADRVESFPVPGPITLDVRVAAGAIEIHAEPRDTAQVEVSPIDAGTAGSGAAEATRISLTGDTLVVAAPEASGWRWRRSPRLRVTARVPEHSVARIRAGSADLNCTGEWARAKLNTASGDTHVERVTDDMSVHTASGDVRAGQVDGRLTVRSASGDVTARRVAGSVDVTSASGHIQIDSAGGDVRLKTASGNATVGASQAGTVRVNTVSGDVSIGVVSGTGVWLDLNTVAGKTSSDLTMGGDRQPVHDLTLQARTVSGNILVHRATPPARPEAQT